MTTSLTISLPTQMLLSILNVSIHAQPLTRGSAASAGLDIYSIEDITIDPKQRVLARTGLAVAVPLVFTAESLRARTAVKNGLTFWPAL
jgi:dUTPase